MRMSRARSAAARVRDRVSLGANGRSVLLVCLTAFIASVATAGAASLITGKDVQNGSLTGADVKSRSVPLGDLSRGTQTLIKRAGLSGGATTPGAQGENGQNGANGAKGDKGDKGDNGLPGQNGQNGSNGSNGANGAAAVGPHWGPVARNTTGASSTDLRNGPFVTVAGPAVDAPPFGDGSLGMNVKAGEKASFGNEVDFFGDLVEDLSDVGFRVYQTGENASNNPSSRNMPNITFEIDPNLTGGSGTNFSSLVWAPDGAGVLNRWSPYLDATSTGDWYLTGAAGTETGCNQSTTCSFVEVQDKLDDTGDPATILSATVVKGTDSNWVGAVDGLRINDDLFDFELFGTVTRDATP